MAGPSSGKSPPAREMTTLTLTSLLAALWLFAIAGLTALWTEGSVLIFKGK